MAKTFRAIYENGVFRPIEKIDLPEHSEVTIELEPIDPDLANLLAVDPASMQSIYDLLCEEFDSGQTDLAARHNEHQP